MSRNDPQAAIVEYGQNGIYQLSVGFTLAAGQVAGSDVFSFRWTDPARLAIIDYFRMSILCTQAFTATGIFINNAFIARGYTVDDAAGTAISLAGNNNKRRTNMATSLVNTCRASAVAAGLTVGTRTLDGNPFLRLEWIGTITNINTQPYATDFDARDGATEPIVLAQNEGIIITNATLLPAAGAAFLIVDIGWAEVDGF